jgi:selenocysteine lyase/cysteine desulfurase
VNPVEEIGAITREHGIPYLVDACQSAGQMPLDVEALGCDMLSATGRKFLRGPRGTGFLYVRRAILDRLEPPLLDLHAATWTGRDTYELRGDARRFENWETNVAGKIALGVAVDYALGWGLQAIWGRVRSLADGLRAGLAALPSVTLRDRGAITCGIVTFTTAGKEPAAIRDALRERGVNVTDSPAEYTRLDMEARGLTGVVRASVHYYNTEEEVARFCDELAALP